MITFSLDAPDPWGPNLRDAARSWPSGVAVAGGTSTATGSAPSTTTVNGAVHASLRDPTQPATVGGASLDGARALISSRHPLEPARLTAWARRCVSRLPAAAELAWPTGDESIEVVLPRDASAVRTARQQVTRLFQGSPRLDDILLAASELAANAVQHGGGPTSLVITLGGGRAGAGPRRGVVIEVGDRSVAAAPVVLPLRVTTATGRGMAIVDVVSDCWGVLGLGAQEKIVWCEFFQSGLEPTR
jgi:hypothetical protein